MTALALALLAAVSWYFGHARPRHRKALRQREARIAELSDQVAALDAALAANASGEAWAQAVRAELNIGVNP